MKKLIAIAAVLAFSVGAAQAQTSASSKAEVDGNSIGGADVGAKASVHHRRHRHTTGIGSENNAAARGSVLPGKDRLNSKAYVVDH